MPVVSEFLGILIRMYFNEHNPPHFHAFYQGHKAVFNIKTCEMVKGKFPKRQRKFVETWAELNKEELLANWMLLQNDERAISIAPLRK